MIEENGINPNNDWTGHQCSSVSWLTWGGIGWAISSHSHLLTLPALSSHQPHVIGEPTQVRERLRRDVGGRIRTGKRTCGKILTIAGEGGVVQGNLWIQGLKAGDEVPALWNVSRTWPPLELSIELTVEWSQNSKPSIKRVRSSERKKEQFTQYHSHARGWYQNAL